MVGRLHFYPGMGATAAMYGPLWRHAFPAGQFHDWPEWLGETTITALAARLIRCHGISAGDVVVGTSLGGIVAGEIVNQVELSGIVLVASARERAEIRGLLATLSPLIDIAPMQFLRVSAGKIPGELTEMFAAGEPEFIRSMCRAVFHWDGLQRSVPCVRIHGRHDPVIPLPAKVDHVIDGGHLIVMTHAEACIAAMG